MKTILHLSVVLALSCATTVSAQTYGKPDSTYANMGTFVQDIHGNLSYDLTYDGVALPDGKVMMVGHMDAGGGTSDMILVLLKANGTPDSSFGTNGIAQYDFSLGGNEQGYAICRQGDGKYVVGGSVDNGTNDDMLIARIMPDGTLDYSFGQNGTTVIDNGSNDYVKDMAILPNGVIIAGGYSLYNDVQSVFIRLLPNGAPDSANFDGDGVSAVFSTGVDFNFREMKVEDDGTIIFCGVQGNSGFIAKLGPDGYDAPNFDWYYLTMYTNMPTQFEDVVTDPLGNIYACGHFNDSGDDFFIMVKLNSAGVPDNTFDLDGIMESIYTVAGEDLIFTEALNVADGILCGAKASNNFVTVIFDRATGVMISDYGDGQVYSINEGSPSFAVDITEMIQLDDQRAMVIGTTFASSYDATAQAFWIVNPLTLAVENVDQVQLTVFPNPATESFSIDVPAGESIKSVSMYNLAGQLIHTFPGNQSTFALPYDLQSTTYILCIQLQNSLSVRRIMVIK